jgi:hypothetical protein
MTKMVLVDAWTPQRFWKVILVFPGTKEVYLKQRYYIYRFNCEEI